MEIPEGFERDYLAGMPTTELAEKYHFSRRAIYYLAKRAGLKRPEQPKGGKKRPIPEGFAEIHKEMSIDELREMFGSSNRTVIRWTQELGEPHERRNGLSKKKMELLLSMGRAGHTVQEIAAAVGTTPDAVRWRLRQARMRPAPERSRTLCEACRFASWGRIAPCSWAARLEPVEGWTAEPSTTVRGSYRVIACPHFEEG